MKRSLARRIALACVATLLPLLLLELVLRMLDRGDYAELGSRERFSEQLLERRDGSLWPRPDTTTSYLGKVVTVGARGLRTPAFAVPKPADVFRILVLGDSLVFGWGVGDDEAFPRLLERMLAERRSADGKRFEVVSAGFPGWNIAEEWRWLKATGRSFAPDVVLHCVIANDIEAAPPARLRILSSSLRRVHVLRLVENTWNKLAGPSPDPKTAVTPELLVLSLNVMQETCISNATRYVYLDTVGVPEAAAHCERAGIARIPVVLPPAWVIEHALSKSDTHPDAAGHRHIAELTLPGLLRIIGSR